MADALGVADEFSNELAAADPDLATSARRALDIADEYCRLAILWSGVLDVSRLDAWLYVADRLLQGSPPRCSFVPTRPGCLVPKGAPAEG